MKICLGTILLISLGVRLVGITWGLPSKSLTLTTYHPDEAITLYAMERMLERGDLYPDDALWWGSFHYYATGAVFLGAKILGLVNISDRSNLKKSLLEADKLYLIGRLLSVVAGLISIVFISFVGKRLFGSLGGILAGTLFAFSPAAVASDHFLKPDSFFLAFGIAGLWLAFKANQEGINWRRAFIIGLIFGFSASSKYSGFLFWPIAPLVSYLTANKDRKFFLALVSLLGLSLGFVLTCPYSVVKPFSFWHYLTGGLSKITSEGFGGQTNLFVGIYETVTYYLPFATSWPTVLMGLVGLVLLVRYFDFEQKIIFLSGGLITFLVISASHAKNAIYTFPFLPFLILGASYALKRVFEKNRFRGTLLIGFCLSVQLVEGVALARLFSLPNTREKSSEWLLKNVPYGTEIGIVKSYYWTVPILRTYESPYKIIKGGSDHSALHEAVLGWTSQSLPGYFVVSGPEYKNFLKGNWPGQRSVIERIFSSYNQTANFFSAPHLLGFRLWLRDPPYDLDYIAPMIHILKR